MLNSELDVIKFWDENNIFQKSIDQNKNAQSYTFLDGPPFVTGTPHLGHLSTGFPKDTLPRYWTQRGKYCIRRWGWDCHGLPIENMVQQTLGITHKRQIEEEIGIKKFNQTAKESISKFDNVWRESIKRSGRWVDMDDQYRTMDFDYMESVWWGLGQLWEKKLLYKDYRVSMYSPSMGASLSHMEIADDIKYVDETISSPIVRFNVKTKSKETLLSGINEEINFNYSEQVRYRIDVEKRIETLQNLDDSKKRTSLQELLNSNDKAFSGLEWENFQTNLQAEEELEHLLKQLEYIKENIRTLAKYKKIASSTLPLNFLVWTTTPWTLPVNVALGVGSDIEYSIFYLEQSNELVILAENRARDILSLKLDRNTQNSPEILDKLNQAKDSGEYFNILNLDIIKLASISGKDLEGINYEPVFLNTQTIDSYEQKANMYKVYTTSVVTDTDGTGVLHIAPAYGIEDFEIKKIRNLPVLKILNEYGEVTNNLEEKLFPIIGKKFTATETLILDILEKYKNLFAIKKFTHKYPTFNRDGKKVYYSAEENWFIGETKFLDSSLEQNQNINWFPKHIKNGRFKAGLETAPDWCISRKRYWGNPLPIWQTKEKNKTIFIDSVEKLCKFSLNPTYKIINSRNLDPKIYENNKVVIFTDGQNKLPLGINASQYRSKSLTELRRIKDLDIIKFSTVAQSILDEMIELFEKYKTIQTLFNDAEQTLWTTWLYNLHPNSKKIAKNIYFYKKLTQDSNGDFEASGNIKILDLHRPNIDDIILEDEVKNNYYRIPEVMDCWVESGSMPWASFHYPFENKDFVEKNIPANYIVEYEGQIRGWFHALHILSTGIFGKNCFQNVHVHGTLLGNDGKKISKSKGNFRPLEEYFQKYGSDALRLYFLSSPYFEGESISLNEKEMQSVFRSSTLLIANSIKYVEYIINQYSRRELPKTFKHPLNRWWYNYTLDFNYKINNYLENYNLNEASRLIIPYIDNLSTWYIRRSKDLLDSDGVEIASCLKETLKIFCTAAASIQPFNTERIWSIVKDITDPESIHLTRIQLASPINNKQEESLKNMSLFRELISIVHGIRKDNQIRVRQPLYADFEELELDSETIEILKKECNLIDKDLSRMEGEIWNSDKYFGNLKVDLVIDNNLAILGFTRDFERAVQSFRKSQGFRANQHISMKWQLTNIKDEEILEKVLKNINWNKLNIEVKWVENLTKLDTSFEVKELVTIFVS
jgi:isoleucyl-tRNA synthetase